MYYRIIAGQDVFELNPGLRSVPLFKDMTDMQMKYVCFVCDPSWDNPVRTLLGKKRKEEAARLAGYKMENTGKRLDKQGRDITAGSNNTIENGILEFKKLHYDGKTDTYETLSNQIGEIQDFMKMKKGGDAKKLKQGLELGVKLPALVEAKQKIELLLSVETTIRPQVDSNVTSTHLPVEEKEEETSEPQSILDRFHNKRTIN